MINPKFSDIESMTVVVTIKGTKYVLLPKQQVDPRAAALIRITLLKALLETHAIAKPPENPGVIKPLKKK